MKLARFALPSTLALAASLLLPAPARAQGYTLTILHAFTQITHNGDNNGENLDGIDPNALTLDGQGHLYGTAPDGGTMGLGTLFAYDLDTKTFTVLVDFTGANGANPKSPVTLDGQGHLYGMTNNNNGSVYEYDLAHGALTTLVHFNGKNGSFPSGSVALDEHGHLFGTTSTGGTGGKGTVFRLDLATRCLTKLVQFNGSNGAYPYAGVILDGKGHLFGTTSAGGSASQGTLFQVDLATRALTTLVNFTGKNGVHPDDAVTLDGSGSLYGTTLEGGANHNGTLFVYALATHTLTTLVNFNNNRGEYPVAAVTLDGQGHLYGATSGGGSGGRGTVFAYTLATGGLTTLVSFKGFNGSSPATRLALDANGILYGTTIGGGASNTGTLYALMPNP